MAASIPFIVLCVVFASQASAQFLAGQEVDVSTYTNELYYESAGSYQRILYEDGVNSTTITNLIWSEVYVAPCGIWLPMLHDNLSELTYITEGQVFVGCKFSNAINKGGCRNFTAGSVVPVEANTLHSAENPSCTPIRAFQAFTGQSHFQQIDMLSAILALSPSSVEYGLNISAAQVQSSASSIMPLFTVNQACLAACNSSATAPASAAG
uniref:Putative extracellular protein TR9_055 n=1 Tax=Trebouxia lynnae TaxID=1825957 RepID=A0A7L9QEI3_9CHLO|nr:putative extracellular protein TR9_055 [Trebouxia lynnae]